MTDAKQYGCIILAAGSSSRLGKAKQLLPLGNTTLLGHTLAEASKVITSPIVIVLGAEAEKIKTSLPQKQVTIVYNDHWEEGIGSSIRCGIAALQNLDEKIEGVVMIVCDQPYLSGELIRDLLTTHAATGKGIVASTYKDTFGTPVFFHRNYFHILQALKGDTGAKKIILQHPDDLITVPFPQGDVDIDTAEDYRALS